MLTNSNITSRFDEIYSSTQKSVLSFVTAKCRHTADIHDILQEIYLELYIILCKRGASYVKNENAFVLKLARQKLSRYYSLLNKLRNIFSLTAADSAGEETEVSDYDVNGFLLEEFVVDNLMLEKVQQLITTKPENVKKVFYLFFIANLTIRETAKILSLGESNVKNMLYRTIKELRYTLQ